MTDYEPDTEALLAWLASLLGDTLYAGGEVMYEWYPLCYRVRDTAIVIHHHDLDECAEEESEIDTGNYFPMKTRGPWLEVYDWQDVINARQQARYGSEKPTLEPIVQKELTKPIA